MPCHRDRDADCRAVAAFSEKTSRAPQAEGQNMNYYSTFFISGRHGKEDLELEFASLDYYFGKQIGLCAATPSIKAPYHLIR